MEPFIRLEAIAAPLPLANVDTDKVLAGRFLKTITRAGLGEKLFWSLRQDPAFVLNNAPWSKAGILVALDNFGCGSSREHAPWALLDFGIRCVIAPSIADIFFNNCTKNGILPVRLDEREVRRLMALAAQPATARMTVDLHAQTIASADGRTVAFQIDPRPRDDLLNGIDDIEATLGRTAAIDGYEVRSAVERPWMTDLRDPGYDAVFGR